MYIINIILLKLVGSRYDVCIILLQKYNYMSNIVYVLSILLFIGLLVIAYSLLPRNI